MVEGRKGECFRLGRERERGNTTKYPEENFLMAKGHILEQGLLILNSKLLSFICY